MEVSIWRDACMDEAYHGHPFPSYLRNCPVVPSLASCARMPFTLSSGVMSPSPLFICYGIQLGKNGGRNDLPS